MASRPVFLVATEAEGFVREKPVEFHWYPGMSVTQKQRSISALHESVRSTLQVSRILEISSKSADEVGRKFSAFTLQVPWGSNTRPLEVVFQASKVFAEGGPFTDLLEATPRDAKRDERLRFSGPLKCFEIQGESWPLDPPTVFYDWLYAKGLAALDPGVELLAGYDAFTDIEFNPDRSLNCQARAAAYCVGLQRANLFAESLNSPAQFLALHQEAWSRALRGAGKIC